MNKPFELKPCEECNGTGETMIEKHYCDCPYCLGTGWEEPAKRITNLEIMLGEHKQALESGDVHNNELAGKLERAWEQLASATNKTEFFEQAFLTQGDILERITMQRDTLAEALREITTYDQSDGQCNSGYSCKYIAEQALQSLNQDHTVDANDMTVAVKEP